jgi:hypothetical protein
MPTNKNLGPGIMNCDRYIEQVFHEHLLTPTYLQLSDLIANQIIINTKQLLIEAFNTHRNVLSQPEFNYFIRNFWKQHCTRIFYCMPKVHKILMKLQPVVSHVNSFS